MHKAKSIMSHAERYVAFCCQVYNFRFMYIDWKLSGIVAGLIRSFLMRLGLLPQNSSKNTRSIMSHTTRTRTRLKDWDMTMSMTISRGPVSRVIALWSSSHFINVIIGKFLPTRRTPGISTSALLERIVDMYQGGVMDRKLKGMGRGDLTRSGDSGT